MSVALSALQGPGPDSALARHGARINVRCTCSLGSLSMKQCTSDAAHDMLRDKCRQVKGLDGRPGHVARVTVLQHDECQTEDSASIQQGGDRRPSVFTRPDASMQRPPAQVVDVQPPDPAAEGKRERAVTALSAATKQRAFDAWLDVRARRQGLLAAAASLWTVGTLRGAWAHWQAEHRRTASQLERANHHAGVAVSRRAMQVRNY